MTRRYSELICLPTYEERLEYCNLYGKVGEETFGYDRWINQALYFSEEWRIFRRKIILRDYGCDLAVEGYDIPRFGTIHHLNPITKEDILERKSCVFDPENVVLVAPDTHRFIHYGHEKIIVRAPIIRRPNDTCPWK